MSEARKVILYIAMSLDGYIAGKDDDLAFLSMVEKEGEDYGYNDFVSTIDTVIMGRKTYDKVLSFGIPFPHINKKTFVVTRSVRPSVNSIDFYSGNISSLITDLKQKNGKHIYVDGGAELVGELMKFKLIDEFVISIIPIFLGEGNALFKTITSQLPLELLSVRHFQSGLVQLHYTAK